MTQYVYKGLTEEEKKSITAALLKGITPPESRGQPSKYRIDKEDDEDVKDQKRALKAKWLKMREKETEAEVDARDKSMTLLDIDKKVVFEKGKPVEILAGTDIAKRLDALCGVGKKNVTTRLSWEKLPEVVHSAPKGDQKKG